VFFWPLIATTSQLESLLAFDTSSAIVRHSAAKCTRPFHSTVHTLPHDTTLSCCSAGVLTLSCVLCDGVCSPCLRAEGLCHSTTPSGLMTTCWYVSPPQRPLRHSTAHALSSLFTPLPFSQAMSPTPLRLLLPAASLLRRCACGLVVACLRTKCTRARCPPPRPSALQ
jgi:hypothetical protein